MRRLDVAVIGLGIGAEHLKAYAALPDLFAVRALCDLDPVRLVGTADAHGVERRLTSVKELLALDGIDLIDICTPPNTHFDLISQALASGRHAICEKPLVGSLRDVDRLAELEARSGRHILPIFQYRFGNGLQQLKQLVDQGLAGPAYLTTIETSWKRGPDYYAVPWRGKWATEMGGVCLTQAIHAHDMLSYINGPLARVYARLTTRVNAIEVEDCAAISVEMADGSLATLSATLGSAEQISRLRFVFRNLTAESNLDPYRPSRAPWRFIGADAAAQARIDDALAGFSPGREFFEGQFALIHAALNGHGPVPVGLDDARASLELITAIYHSARSGEAVALPIGPRHPLYGGWLPATETDR